MLMASTGVSSRINLRWVRVWQWNLTLFGSQFGSNFVFSGEAIEVIFGFFLHSNF